MNDQIQPVMRWNDDREFTDTVVWWSRLDSRYLVEVRRLEPYKGKLYIFDRKSDYRLVHSQEVSFMFDAIFGPDVDDVNTWQVIALDYADGKGSR